MIKEQGMLIVLSGPSGVGKGTVNAELRKRHPELLKSISLTTREPRSGEVHGRDYLFVTREEFISHRDAGELLEWAEYVGNFYGTPRRYVEEQLAAGKSVILEIETEGGLQLKRSMPKSVFIFLAPPQFETLKTRILRRGGISEEVLARRVERAHAELQSIDAYEYLVINERVESAVVEIEAILVAESRKVTRRQALIAELKAY